MFNGVGDFWKIFVHGIEVRPTPDLHFEILAGSGGGRADYGGFRYV
jgi:hypothetical protein